MNKKEHEKYLKEFKKYLKEKTATKESSTAFLQKLGVHTPTGRLTKNYDHKVLQK